LRTSVPVESSEPTLGAEYGTYAGAPLRTAWWTDRAGQIEESFFTVVVNREGLRFYIVGRGMTIASRTHVRLALVAAHRRPRVPQYTPPATADTPDRRASREGIAAPH